MIELVFDTYGLEEKGSALVLSHPTAYAECRLRIRQAVVSGTNLRVIVTNPGMASWFEDLLQDDRIEVRTRDPIKEMREAFGTADLPTILLESPGLVGEWDLLRDTGNKPSSQTVVDWILARRMAQIWGRTHLSAEDVAELVGWLAAHPWRDIEPGLTALAMLKFDSWTTEPGLDALLAWMKENPHKRSHVFALAQRLVGYPSSCVMAWLGHEGWAELVALEQWSKLTNQLPLVGLDLALIPSALNVSVRLYLLSQLSSPEKLDEVVAQISGSLPGEVAALDRILDGRVAPVSRKAVEDLRAKFGDHPVVSAFEELVPPAPPLAFPGESAEAVLEWVVSSYIPFYRWTRRTKQGHLTAEWAGQFETWQVRNFPLLSQKLELTTLGITDHAAKFAHDGVLLVIIDGLGAEWTNDLIGILEGHDLLQVAPTQARFTVAPSITAYAKAAMIRGLRPMGLPDKSWNTGEYESLLRSRWTDRSVHAISDLDHHRKLRQLVTAEEDGKGFYLYLANRLDDLLHQSMSAQKRWHEVRAYLVDICASIREACEYYDTSFGKPLPVVITGDHGHCILPSCATGLGSPEVGCVTHGRVVELEETPFSVPNGAILLEPEMWGLKRPVLVASIYSYWGSRPAGGVHGGLTPEEMVTPVLTVQRGVGTSECDGELAFAVLGTVRRSKPTNHVSLEITNPNSLPIKLVDLEVNGIELLQPDTAAKVEAENKVEIEVNIDGRGLKSEVEILEGRCTYRCAGRTTQQQIRIPVRTTGGAIDDFDMF